MPNFSAYARKFGNVGGKARERGGGLGGRAESLLAQLSHALSVQLPATMKHEDEDELWDLLGKADQPAPVSPFFARNVLREIRQRPTWRDRLSPWFSLRRLLPVSVTAVAALAAVGLALYQPVQRPVTAEDEPPPDAVAQLDPIDFAVVADLDDLLALEEDSLWSDPDVSTL